MSQAWANLTTSYHPPILSHIRLTQTDGVVISSSWGWIIKLATNEICSRDPYLDILMRKATDYECHPHVYPPETKWLAGQRLAQATRRSAPHPEYKFIWNNPTVNCIFSSLFKISAPAHILRDKNREWAHASSANTGMQQKTEKLLLARQSVIQRSV